MNSTILTVTPKDTESSHVLIDSLYANRLHGFLTEKGLNPTPIEEAVFTPIRAYADKDGRKQVETEVLDMSFDVQATSKQLETIVSEWINEIQK